MAISENKPGDYDFNKLLNKLLFIPVMGIILLIVSTLFDLNSISFTVPSIILFLTIFSNALIDAYAVYLSLKYKKAPSLVGGRSVFAYYYYKEGDPKSYRFRIIYYTMASLLWFLFALGTNYFLYKLYTG